MGHALSRNRLWDCFCRGQYGFLSFVLPHAVTVTRFMLIMFSYLGNHTRSLDNLSLQPVHHYLKVNITQRSEF